MAGPRVISPGTSTSCQRLWRAGLAAADATPVHCTADAMQVGANPVNLSVNMFAVSDTSTMANVTLLAFTPTQLNEP